MFAAWLIGGVLVLAGIIWGIIAFIKYVEEKYDYNVFNIWNIVMLLVMFFIWLIVLWLGYATESQGGSFDILNYWVCGIVTAILFVIMFIRNLKNTSLPIAVGASALQVASIAVIALIIAVTLLLSGRRRV